MNIQVRATSLWTLVSSAIFLVAVMGPALAQEMTLSSAINKAGRQRMLTQRIVLIYCQAGLGVMTEDSERRLTAAVALFDEQLTDLKVFSAGTEVRDALRWVEDLWSRLKVVAQAPKSREGAKKLLSASDDLLYATNKVVQLLQDISNMPYARLVNVSGRQRMLSQRAAKYYMLREWGFDSLTIRDEEERARNEFKGAHLTLLSAPENSDAIRRELAEVEVQWAWFENALTLKSERSFHLVVADSAEEILETMDRVTSMYEQLMQK